MATTTEDKPKTARTRARRTTRNGDGAPQPDGSNRKARSSGNGTSTGTLIGVAAAGAALGVAAMIGRKAAVQAPTYFAGEWDQALAAEHKAVIGIFDLLQATTDSNTTKRAMLLMQLKHALAKHALEEENAIYPALRDAGQTEAADSLNHDHGYVKQYLYELTNCPKGSTKFLEIVARFRVDLEKHVREEEDVLFPQLKAQLGDEANATLTAAMNKEGFKLA